MYGGPPQRILLGKVYLKKKGFEFRLGLNTRGLKNRKLIDCKKNVNAFKFQLKITIVWASLSFLTKTFREGLTLGCHTTAGNSVPIELKAVSLWYHNHLANLSFLRSTASTRSKHDVDHTSKTGAADHI